MNTTTIAAIAALIIVVGGAVYYNAMYPKADMMIEKGDAMMDEGKQMVLDGADMVDQGTEMKKEGEKMMFTDESGNTTELTAEEGVDWMEKAPEGAMMSAGSYEPYSPEKLARAADGDVVLFFRASWCPTCRGLDADIVKNRAQIPKGLTILDVDYDNSTALKQKYGITYQHTLVQVDADGTQIAKWSSSPTLAALAAQVK